MRGFLSSTKRSTLALFALSLAAQLPLLLQYRGDPFARTMISDALSYDAWGMQIATRGLAAEPVFHQAPLFPLLLSWLDRALGPAARLEGAVVLGCVLTSLAIALLVPLGRLYLDSEGAGALGGLLVLLHGPFAFHSLKLLPVALALATAALALVALGSARAQGTLRSASIAGVCLGIAALARSELLLFVPFALVALVRGATRRLTLCAAFLLGLCLSLAPATLHNLRQGDLVLIASSGGENLYIGNRIGAQGDYTPLHPKAGDLFSERLLAREVAEKESGRPLRASEVSAFWRRKAQSEILARPGAWLRLEARKLARILSPGDPTDIYSFPLERSLYLTWLHVFPLSAWFLVGGGALGVVLALRRLPERAWPLAALAGTQLAILLLFFVNTRLRLPWLFVLAPFAGFGLIESWNAWRERRRRVLVASLLGCLASFGILGAVLTRAEPRDVLRLASVLSTQNRIDDALAVLAPVLSSSPPYALALDEAGWLLQKKGDLARARDRYREALAAGMPEGRTASTRSRLASVLEAQGELEAAAREHDAAVEGKDADAGTYYERGMFRSRRGARLAAIADLEEAARREPAWDAPRAALLQLRGT